MRIFSGVLFLLILQFSSFAQQAASTKVQELSIGDAMILGANQIAAIKSNGVFIRLRTNDKAIAALTKAGRQDQVDIIKTKQSKLNQEILDAFAKQFHFTRVYYFFSRNQVDFNKGDFSMLYNLDGSKADYKAKDFFIIDPYVAEVKSMNSQSTGFTLLTRDGEMTKYPMPITIIKRFGPFYKTYPQLVFDWNFMFNEMSNLGEQIETGLVKAKLKKANSTYTRAETKEIIKLRKLIRKSFKDTYNWSKRPKNSNKGS